MHADPLDAVAFEKFVAQRKADLKRIRHSTRNEYDFADVVNEGWLMANELGVREGTVVNLLDKSFQDLLISHLYQHLVRYTERTVRYAARLDHAAPGSDQDSDSNPISRMLISDNGQHPLTILSSEEEASPQHLEIDIQQSIAGAYVRLLRRFDNKMRAVANHLRISISYAYRRCAHAQLLAIAQKPFPVLMMEEKFIPGPWRRSRLMRTPIQLAFDFDDELPLELPQP